jgi:hypothetical protein
MPFAPTALQVSLTDPINQALGDAVGYLPTLVAAALILVLGYLIGRFLGSLVSGVVRRIGIDGHTAGTPLESIGSGEGIARVLGTVVAYYVYFVAIIAAANVLDIPQLTDLLADLGAFLPIVLGALAVLVVGFVAGRIIGDIVAGVVSGFAPSTESYVTADNSQDQPHLLSVCKPGVDQYSPSIQEGIVLH